MVTNRYAPPVALDPMVNPNRRRGRGLEINVFAFLTGTTRQDSKIVAGFGIK
jgi:hypothetical protein